MVAVVAVVAEGRGEVAIVKKVQNIPALMLAKRKPSRVAVRAIMVR
jgi:hypothetical protein